MLGKHQVSSGVSAHCCVGLQDYKISDKILSFVLITSTLTTHSWSQEREGEIQQTCSMSTITYNQISKEEPTISTKTYHVRFMIHPLSLPLVGPNVMDLTLNLSVYINTFST